MSHSPQPPAGTGPTDPTAPPAPAPWVPPDPPAPSSGAEPGPWITPPTGDATGWPPPYGEPAGEQRPARDGRFTTVALSVFTAVVVAVCGCLGVGSLLFNLPPDRHEDPVAEEPQQDAPATPDEEGSEPSKPDPTPTRKPASTPSNGPGRIAVVYDVTGQGPADIQYHDADGYLIQLEGVRLPWHRKISTDDPSQAYVMANKADDRGGRTIACSLTVNGGRPVTESADDGGWRVSCGG
jgi:Mycobacterium membrane protein